MMNQTAAPGMLMGGSVNHNNPATAGGSTYNPNNSTMSQIVNYNSPNRQQIGGGSR